MGGSNGTPGSSETRRYQRNSSSAHHTSGSRDDPVDLTLDDDNNRWRRSDPRHFLSSDRFTSSQTMRTPISIQNSPTPGQRYFIPSGVSRTPSDTSKPNSSNGPSHRKYNYQFGFLNSFSPQNQTISSPRTNNHKIRRSCLSCLDLGVGCDGEQPCSNCAEPGLPCEYAGEIARKGGLNPSIVPIRKDKQGTDPNSKNDRQDIFPPKFKSLSERLGLSPDLLLKSSSPKLNSDNDDAESLAESVDSSDIETLRLDPVDIEQVMNKIEVDMRSFQEYWLQPKLREAKLDSQKSFPPMIDCTTDQFEKLKQKRSKERQSQSSADTAHIQVKIPSKGSKWNSIHSTITKTSSDAQKLPKYKSIGRLGPSLLARNVRTSKYRPYDAADERLEDAHLTRKYNELMQRYEHNDPSMKAQRVCLELIGLWRSWADIFIQKCQITYGDILYYYTHPAEEGTRPIIEMSDSAWTSWRDDQHKPCQTCSMEWSEEIQDKWSPLSSIFPTPDERSLAIAGLACNAFHKIAKISLWHIALTSKFVENTIGKVNFRDKSLPMTYLCSICYLHDCPIHGAYIESDGDDSDKSVEAFINDEEEQHNVRQYVSLPSLSWKNDSHLCGVYCLEKSVSITEILGMNADGSISGLTRPVTETHPSFQDDELCSSHCFWWIEKRLKSKISDLAMENLTPFNQSQLRLFEEVLPTVLNNKRGPCMISKIMGDMKCSTIFYHMLNRIGKPPHNDQTPDTPQHQGRKVSKIQSGLDTSMSAELDSRPPFVPCCHEGLCQNNPDCSCAENKVACEWFCGCDMSCKRRFKGCNCSGISKTCFNDSRCECWVHNRECDPWLCKSCGVLEVLDSQNKYNEEIRKGRCKNNRIQLDLPARTIKAASEVQGYGLFAGEDLEEHAYIGEYRGEITSISESDRRGAVYHIVGAEYLFVINQDQEMDASNMGNKMRFMNNSQRESNINVVAKKMLCNGVQRVMLYARRRIKSGEELLYNYNYPVAVTKKFWEKGEKPTTNTAIVTTIMPKTTPATQLRVNGRFARRANAPESNDKKRNRENLVIPAKIDTTLTDDEDDDDNDAESDSDSESESEILRKRKINPNDRRIGGKAQAAAWKTRKKNWAGSKGFNRTKT